MSKGKEYKINLVIESAAKYREYLPEITIDYRKVCDNIAYHFSYLEYLYQLREQIPLGSYQILDGLRIKTIIMELSSVAEVLLFDSLKDISGPHNKLKINPKTRFSDILKLAVKQDVICSELSKRIEKLADLRNKIHLTHGQKDPHLFNNTLLIDAEKTVEDLFKCFVQKRWRGVFSPVGNVSKMRFPWN